MYQTERESIAQTNLVCGERGYLAPTAVALVCSFFLPAFISIKTTVAEREFETCLVTEHYVI
jgi:hypothetical protein